MPRKPFKLDGRKNGPGGEGAIGMKGLLQHRKERVGKVAAKRWKDKKKP